MGEVYTIAVSSNYSELWRYNIAIVTACLDENRNQIEVVAERSHLADVGSNLSAAEGEWMARNKISLMTPTCDAVEILVYLIPHSLPKEREIEDVPPFEIKISVNRGNKTLHDELHQVNQWSGVSVELKF